MSHPFFSVIIPAYKEGNLINLSLKSILAQSEQDFEIVLVSDGADQKTITAARLLVEKYPDKIRMLEQSNDGLSSARNRALAHSRGRYICFLDGDDTRHPLALQGARNLLESTPVDVLFCGATVIDRNYDAHPFYDDRILAELKKISKSNTFSTELGNIDLGAKFLGFMEPSSSTKFICSEFARKIKLTYPNGLFFEDIFTHIQAASNIRSFAITRVPYFTYHLAYSNSQITSSSDERRFNALSSSFSAIELASRTKRFNDPDFRFSTIHGVARLLNWCEREISHVHRYQFSRAADYFFSRMPKGVILEKDSTIVIPKQFEHLVENSAIEFLHKHRKAWSF